MKDNWHIKSFETLSPSELYQILQLRSEIFVVEQNCVYQDLDFKDQIALHLFLKENDSIIAYCRLFKPKDYYDYASIGRVVVNQNYRNKKLGHLLLKTAINTISEIFNENKITIGAQLYLKKFYESHGFVQTSEMYLEDDIPHIIMSYDNSL